MSSRRIDFNEPIPKMIERLKSEHRSFESKIAEVQGSINNDDIAHATEIIRIMTDKITHHAVEEEARLMRVIMQKAKDESAESIRIMQEHNWVIDFFKNKLGAIENRINSKIDSQIQGDDHADKNQQSKKELTEFVTNLRSHFSEEEQTVFPLSLKADLL
ncbi:MAG TPA: hemerythrin domain-containing protein [Nitrososphaeraceae archaeon]|nr:hemerythrin domain-containing protein [Nitrososphaeraceae archaeon]